MRTKLRSNVVSIILLLLSAGLLILAFPMFEMAWLAWIGLVPLIIVLCGKSVWQAFFLSYLCGVVFFAGVFSWAFEIPGYVWAHHAIIAIYVGFYFGIFGFLFAFFQIRAGALPALLLAPFVWISLEYLRSNMGFLSLPWPLLSHSQYQHLAIIQVASYTGAYGVSFVIILVNSAIAAIILSLIHSSKTNSSLQHFNLPAKTVYVLITVAFIAVFGSWLHGQLVLASPKSLQQLKVAVVQGNIGQEMKANPRQYSNFILQQYFDLTQRAATANPDLIVWPEAATPGLVLKNYSHFNQLVKLIRSVNTHFMIGSSEHSKFATAPSERTKQGNTALYFDSNGKVLGQYLKIRLIPFGEYVPYEDSFPWPQFIVPMGKESYELPGKEFTLFEINGNKFGVVICWESHYADLFRQFVKKGASFMVNITNEGWFGESAAPYQKLVTTVFRAVENRVAIARAANTGVSCFIGPTGRIISRLQKDNKDIFIDGYLNESISISKQRTFYTLYGDIFVIASFMIIVVTFFLALIKRRSDTHNFF